MPHYLLRRGTEVEVARRAVTSRYPDLMVLTDDLLARLDGTMRSLITLDMPAPALVVEVVSPGEANHARDYNTKRLE